MLELQKHVKKSVSVGSVFVGYIGFLPPVMRNAFQVDVMNIGVSLYLRCPVTTGFVPNSLDSFMTLESLSSSMMLWTYIPRGSL